MRFVNLYFPVSKPKGSLRELWKVTADERYHPGHIRGFGDDSLFLTYRGAGDIYLDEGPAPVHLPRGSSFMLPAGHPVHYHRHLYAHEWSFYFLKFHRPAVLKGVDFPWLQVLPLAEKCRILCEGFADEIAWNRPGRDAVLEKGFLEILLSILGTAGDSPQGDTDGIERVLAWMHGHPDLDCRTEDLMALSGLTRTLLFKKFRERTGLPPLLYFRQLKIKAAQSLMETTNLRLSEIGERLNYCDEYYFSRQFKQVTGLSPRSWRQRTRREDRGPGKD